MSQRCIWEVTHVNSASTNIEAEVAKKLEERWEPFAVLPETELQRWSMYFKRQKADNQ